MGEQRSDLDLEKGIPHVEVTQADFNIPNVPSGGNLSLYFGGEKRTIPKVVLPTASCDTTPATSAFTSAFTSEASSAFVSRSPSQSGSPRKPLPLPPKHGSRLTRFLFGMFPR